MATRYVDVDADVGGDGTTNGLTGGTCAYKSLNIWEAARQATLSETETCICESSHASHTADTTSVTLGGWTTYSDKYIDIKTSSGARHAGVWSTSKYRLTVSNSVALWNDEDYVRIDGLQIHKTSSNANFQGVFYTATASAGANDVRISNCILRTAGNASYTEPIILTFDADAVTTIWNCICYGCGTNSGSDNAAVNLTSASSTAIYGCTLIGGRYAIKRTGSAGTVVAKNCYGYGVDGGYYADITLTTCAASDATGTSADLDNIACDTTEGSGHAGFTNVTAGSEDFHLKSGSHLVGKGTTLTDDPPGSTALGVDIDGDARS